jgi:lipopolysaccharide export system protein LptA
MGVEMKSAIASALVLASSLAFAATGPVAAQDARFSGLKLSGDQPIQIESDKLEVNEVASIATFAGNVSVVQGDTVLKAGRMVVHYAKDPNAGASATPSANGAIERLEVDGKVYLKSANQVATGEKGTFDMKTEVLVLSGKEVVLSEGPNVLVGCKLTVQMKSGKANFEGCGGRVKTLLTPGSQGQ